MRNIKRFPISSLLFILLLASCTEKNKNNFGISSVFEAKDYQLFSLDNNDSIVGKEGTIIFLTKSDLVHLNGSYVKESVEIKLTEYYTKADIIKSGITTMSNGRLLETGGMVHIEAIADGKKLKLKDGKAFTIKFPAIEEKPDMEIFYGEVNDGN